MIDTLREVILALQEIGPGRITPSPYDTAWVARLAAKDEPIGIRALEWLRTNQLEDGSWGTPDFVYHHERVAATLAAITAIAYQKDIRDKPLIEKARQAVEHHIKYLQDDPQGETIGFEMIVPSLIEEGRELGVLTQTNGVFEKMVSLRNAKLSLLPNGIVSRYVTVSFSAEMIEPSDSHLVDWENLREANGSVSCSPAATTWFLMNYEYDQEAIDFLNDVEIDNNGSVPYIAPIDVFEIAWSFWNLLLVGDIPLDSQRLLIPNLEFLNQRWTDRGISSVSGVPEFIDGDTTSLTFHVLRRLGQDVKASAVLHHEKDEHIQCFPYEANPSLSTNVHALGALREAGFEVQDPVVQKIKSFLATNRQPAGYWFDKWHASPYYTTSHAIILSSGYLNELISPAVEWILDSQRPDGSWGYYIPTAEETAYCLQALCYWYQHGGKVPIDVLLRGRDWLLERFHPPYPPLWIGKSLYHPEYVLKTAIISAIALVEGILQ